MKVLILQTAFIGDVVLATPLIEAAHKKYPGCEVSFLTIPYSAPVLRNHPGLMEVIIMDKRGKGSWKHTFEITRLIKSQKFDIALVPHRSMRSAAMVNFAGIPQKIGFDRSAGSFWFTKKIKHEVNKHEVKRNLSLLDLEDEEIPPKIYPGDAERESVRILLKEFGIGDEFIAIAPGSIWNTKRWIPEHFSELIRLLNEKDMPPVIMTGGPGERELCQSIQRNFIGYVHVAAGRIDPLESSALLAKAKALVANDSAAGHLAAAVGTKVVTIFGPSIPAFGFSPYGEGHKIAQHPNLYCRPCRIHGSKKCPEKHFRCMKELTPGTVFELLLEII